MKKFLTFILVLAMVLSVSSFAMAAEIEANNANFQTILSSTSAGDTIKLTDNITITGNVILDVNGVNVVGNGKKITIESGSRVNFINANLTGVTTDGAGIIGFGGTVNFYGTNSITTGEIQGTPFDLVVNQNATLLISRFVLGYDRNITVYGNISDATSLTAAGVAGMTPSLKFNSTSGVSVGGISGQTGNLTVKDAYVELDSSSWKNAHGTYEWKFINSYVSATNFTNTNTPGSPSASWDVTFDHSKLATKNYIKVPESASYNFTNYSVATTGSLRVDGELNIDATSSVSTTAQQNNEVGQVDEHGGINGTVNVAGKLNIDSNAKTQLEVLGGSLNVMAGGEVDLGKNELTLDSSSGMTIAGDIKTDDGSNRITVADDSYTAEITEDGDTTRVFVVAKNEADLKEKLKEAVEELIEDGKNAEDLDVNVNAPDGANDTVDFNTGDLPGGVIVDGEVTVNGVQPSGGLPMPTPELPQVTNKPSGSGISVKYNGGNSFSTSNPAVPTGVEIDGVPVTFNGNGSNFTVGCISSDAKWVTVRWNSTTVTTNFTPDGLVECTTVSIPKTGDMPFWAAIAEFLGF